MVAVPSLIGVIGGLNKRFITLFVVVGLSLVLIALWAATLSHSGNNISWFKGFQLSLQRHYARPPKNMVNRPPPDLSKFAVVVKTGAETAAARLPAQLKTFLKDVQNVIFIAETPGIAVGDVYVHDVYTNYYEDALERINRVGENPSSLLNDNNSGIDPNMTVLPDRRRHHIQVFRRSPQGSHEEIKPVTTAQGWKLDAHKNLPGFKLLYDSFPNADWYFMIDDDTFVSQQNMWEYLIDHGKTPEKDAFMGWSTDFIGCDGITEYGQGVKFAHGGSGIAISHSSMKKMIGVIDNCMVKYHGCWGGDVRTALCLRDVGVFLERHQEVNPHPPHEGFSYPPNPCRRPSTFHHLLPHQLELLHKLDSDPNYPLTYASAFKAFIVEKDLEKLGLTSTAKLPSYGFLFDDMDTPGGDFADRNVEDVIEARPKWRKMTLPEVCAMWCAEVKQCIAWAYGDNRCWLKDRYMPRRRKEGVVFGYVPKHYECRERRPQQMKVETN